MLTSLMVRFLSGLSALYGRLDGHAIEAPDSVWGGV